MVVPFVFILPAILLISFLCSKSFLFLLVLWLKYFEDITTAEVHLKKQGDDIYCSIVVNNVYAKGSKISADAENHNARKSFDESLKKLVSQLKTEKNKALAKKKKGQD